MIVKLGAVRDGAIEPAQWFSSKDHVIVPMFTASEMQATVNAFRQNGPAGLAAHAPQHLQRDLHTLTAFILGGWNEYLASLPPNANPLFTVNGKSGLVLPDSINRSN